MLQGRLAAFLPSKNHHGYRMCRTGEILSLISVDSNIRPGKYLFIGMKNILLGGELCYCLKIKEILLPKQLMNIFLWKQYAGLHLKLISMDQLSCYAIASATRYVPRSAIMVESNVKHLRVMYT